MLVLGTDQGIIEIGLDGAVISQALEDTLVTCAVPTDGGYLVGTESKGVLLGAGDSWRTTGLADRIVWTVAVSDAGPLRQYAGTEPAGIWLLDGYEWMELASLGEVDGADEWHSPWGPADLCSIVVEENRLIVGIEVGGIAVSADEGRSWRACNFGLFEDVHRVVADGDLLYATTGGGVHRSSDGGETWSWQAEGIDRGYTQGLVLSNGHVLVAASSGPPPLWAAGGPEAAIFRAKSTTEPMQFDLVIDGFAGNIDRRAMACLGERVAAGTSEGELLWSEDSGASFSEIAAGLPPITSVAFID